MKAGPVICCCVWLGICSTALWGQQIDPDNRGGLQLAAARMAVLPLHDGYSPAVTASLPLPTSLAFSTDTPLEEAVATSSAETVCTQAEHPQLLSSNAFDRLNFSSSGIKSIFTHENMVKMARNFKPGQSLPDAPSYVALTKRQKFDMFWHRSYSPDIWSSGIFDSLVSQATGAYPSFGGGMAGYGKRLGVSMAGSEAAAFFGRFLFPTLLHQDPRYFPSHHADTSDRLAYAASRTIIGRSDSGRSVLNTSVILSQFVEAALSNAYVPYRNESVSGTVENALAGLAGVAESNILNEFWPDIKTFFARHEPKSMHRWQDRWEKTTFARRYQVQF